MGKAIACDKEWEANWQAEQDCDALCRAAAVNKDPERLAKAKAYAKKKLNESKARKDQAQAMVDMGEGKNP